MGEKLMFTAGILFCLVLISTSMLGGLYARYVTRASGGDSARVAKFDVVGTGSGLVTVRVEDSETGQYTITVTNRSEVDVSYDVDLLFNREIADWLILQLDGATAAETQAEGQTTFHFEKAGAMDPQESQTKTILFLPEKGITEPMSGLSDSLELDFTVYIHAVQID